MHDSAVANRKVHSLLTLLLLLAGCAGPLPPNQTVPPQTAPASADTPQTSAAPPTVVSGARLTLEEATDVTLYAISLVGTPYRRGGNTTDSGFDCSGLIVHVYQTRAGLKAPRTVLALSNWGIPVRAEQLQSGDLVLFSPKGTATHAGIYVGEGRFVHAPSTGGTVRLDALNSRYWSQLPVSFRRP